MKRFPHPKDIKVFDSILERIIPTDTGIAYAWHRSLNDVPAWRAMGKTRGTDWTADVYAGNHFVVQVGTRPTEICKNLPSLVTYLCRMLGVGLKPSNKQSHGTTSSE